MRSSMGCLLAEVAEFDLLTAAVIVDDRRDYGEARFRAFGRVEGKPRVLAFPIRNGITRAIRYRRAHEEEMERYGI